MPKEILVRQYWSADIGNNGVTFANNVMNNHPYGTAVYIVVNDILYGLIEYDGNMTKWSQGFKCNFGELKKAVETFHINGWKVILCSTLEKGSIDPIYAYVRDLHPELCYINGNGKYCGIPDHPNGVAKNRLLHDPFAIWLTDDAEHGIAVGTRVEDLICERLQQMMQAGILFDGHLLADAWNGFLIWAIDWRTVDPVNSVSWSQVETDDWASSTSITLPTNWNTMAPTQRGTWIRANAVALQDWGDYWSERVALLYRKLKDAMSLANPGQPYYIILQGDFGNQWVDGARTPYDQFDFRLFRKHDAVDLVFPLQEVPIAYGTTEKLPRYETLVAGLVKTKDPSLNVSVAVEGAPWGGTPFPLFIMKQMYLGQSLTYVWHNGQCRRATNPEILHVQYPMSDGSEQNVRTLVSWIENMEQITLDPSLTPLWLGPVYALAYNTLAYNIIIHTLPMIWTNFADSRNFNENPNAVVSQMGCITLDEYGFVARVRLNANVLSRVQSLVQGGLGVALILHGWDPSIGGVFDGDKTALLNLWGLIASGFTQTETLVSVLANITDPWAKWIAQGSEGGYGYSGYGGAYKPATGHIPIAVYSDAKLHLGIKYQNIGNFLLVDHYDESQHPIASPQLYVKAFRWVSYCPIYCENPNVDFKIFRTGDGKVVIPMFDMTHTGLDQPLTLDLTPLADAGILPPDITEMYWQSDKRPVNTTSWDNVSTTLVDGADILVIETGIAPPTPPILSIFFLVALFLLTKK